MRVLKKPIFYIAEIVLISVITFCVVFINKLTYKSYENYKIEDYTNYQKIAEFLINDLGNDFHLFNSSPYYRLLDNSEYIIKDKNIEKLLKKYKKDVYRIFCSGGNVYFCNNDVPGLQSTGGIVVAFDETQLTEKSPQNSGFDNGVSYNNLYENIFFFNAGL